MLAAGRACDKVVRDLVEAGMARPKRTDDGLTKFQRYRQAQLHRGMKQIRIWVPDPHRPEFADEARRQGMLLRGRAEEAEALEFIAAAVAWPEA
jgi:hypothetical protein